MRSVRKAVVLLFCLFLVLSAGCSGIPQTGGNGQQGNPGAGDGLPDGETLEVHFIDVGQGDSILIRCGGESMLIDAGTNESGEAVVDYLKQQNVDSLRYLVGTHPHEDHIGGLDDVIRAFAIEQVIMPDADHTTKTYEDVLDALIDKELTVTSVQPGDVFALGNASFTILSPSPETMQLAEAEDNMNDFSIGLRVEYKDNAFVMCGDAEAAAEENMVRSGLSLQADVLKLGHHGSSTSTCDAFLSAVSPDRAVISCGKDNSYGHPHRETIEKLDAAGIRYYRTDELGSIVAVSDGSTITWSCDEETSGAENGGNTGAVSESYILNRNTMKYHLPSCSSVQQMKEENRVPYEGSREELEAMGYAPCGSCSP